MDPILILSLLILALLFALHRRELDRAYWRGYDQAARLYGNHGLAPVGEGTEAATEGQA